MSKGGDSPIIGYNYYFGIHMGICRGPIDELVAIRVGDREAWPSNVRTESSSGEWRWRAYVDGIEDGDGSSGEPITSTVLPAAAIISAPVAVGSDYNVTIAGDPPATFSSGVAMTITGLVRDGIDVNGTYTIVSAVFPTSTFDGEGGYVVTAGSITINIGNDVGDVADWNNVALSTNFGTEIGLSVPVPPGTTGGYIPVGATTSGRIKIDSPALFGGEHKEGGIQGVMEVMMGESTQVAPSSLSTMLTKLHSVVPGFRGVFTAFFDGLISSLNPYPKPWKFRVRRVLQGWDGSVFLPDLALIRMTSTMGALASVVLSILSAPPGSPAEGAAYIIGPGASGAWTGKENKIARWSSGSWTYYIPQDGWIVFVQNETRNYVFTGGEWEAAGVSDIYAMNPAHIIYECLTNRVWGRGLSTAKLDADSFETTARTLYDETFGLCLRWSRRDSIQSFIQGILDHIGGVLYEDRSTALVKLKLIRQVDPDTLPLFDADNGLIELRDVTVASTGSYVNEVAVTYRDPVTDKDRVVKVDNIASLQASGGAFVSVERNYPGLPTPDLARRIAQRDLKALGVELRRFTLVVDRRAWNVTPGDAIRIRDPLRGVKETVVRVGRVDDGTLLDGKITITAITDMFTMPSSSYVADEPAVVVPDIPPCVGEFLLMELPYAVLARMTTPAVFSTIQSEDGYFGTLVAKGQSSNLDYKLATRAGLPEDEDWPSDDDGSFCGYDALWFRLGADNVALDTGWDRDWHVVEASFITNYKALNGAEWFKHPDYSTLDDDLLPLQMRMAKLNDDEPVYKWRWSALTFAPDDYEHFYGTLEQAIAYAMWWRSNTMYYGAGFPNKREIGGVSRSIISRTPVSFMSSYLHVEEVTIEWSIYRLYGYAGDSPPFGMQEATGTETFYKFLFTEEGDPSLTPSQEYPYERARF